MLTSLFIKIAQRSMSSFLPTLRPSWVIAIYKPSKVLTASSYQCQKATYGAITHKLFPNPVGASNAQFIPYFIDFINSYIYSSC